MSETDIDRVSALKANLELTIAENGEIHEYFRDLLERLGEIEQLPDTDRRERFKDLSSQGAFRFNGLDVRYFTRSHRKPLPPPMFLNRTRRRLKNTATLVDTFINRGLLAEGEQLREEIDALTFEIVDGEDAKEVMGFKRKVDALRDSPLFTRYMETKREFVRKDADFRTDTEFLAAKESVEEGEELFRQREAELTDLHEQIGNESIDPEEAERRLAELTAQGEGAPQPGAEATAGGEAEPDEAPAAEASEPEEAAEA